MTSEHEVVQVESRADWRDWLERNHTTSPGVWLVTWKKAAGRPRVEYDAAVEEGLCFGWVDSKSRTVDDARTSLFFTPRKPKSSWSASNVARDTPAACASGHSEAMNWVKAASAA